MAVREGDRVMVITGKDKGRESRVSRVIPDRGQVIVEGVNVVKRHQRSTGRTLQAGIIEKNMPIDISNVMLMCPECGPVRTGAGFDEAGNKFRRCVKCGQEI